MAERRSRRVLGALILCLLIAGAVAVGMFGMESLGWTIAASHYISVVIVGFLMRFYRPFAPATPSRRERGNLIRRAFSELYRARKADGRPFGELFGDAVKDSFASMLFIGGCIMMFSVLINVLNVAGVADFLARGIALALAPFGAGIELAESIVRGFVEITIGTKAAAEASAPLISRTVVASGIIAWSGLSVHAQVAAMMFGTDVRIGPYILARLLHGVLAALCTWVLMDPMASVFARVAPVFSAIRPQFSTTFLSRFVWSLEAVLAIAALLVLAGIILSLVQRIKIIIIRVR